MNDGEVFKQIEEHLKQGADVRLRTIDCCRDEIAHAATLLCESLAAGGKLLLCGNGGSAADCQHLAAEFVSRLTLDFERPGLPAIALTTDSSVLTAYANDFDFEGVFARQVQALGRPADVLIGISTSGGSRNVVRAVEEARRLGLKVVALTGRKGILADLADAPIRVPSDSTQHLQETHLAIEHLLCHIVERRLFPAQRPKQVKVSV